MMCAVFLYIFIYIYIQYYSLCGVVLMGYKTQNYWYGPLLSTHKYINDNASKKHPS